MRVRKIEHQLVVAWRSLGEIERYLKRMHAAARPGIGRAGLDIGPVFFGVTFADDEIDVIWKRLLIGSMISGNGELAVIAIDAADLEDGSCFLGKGGANQAKPSQTKADDLFHIWCRTGKYFANFS